MEIETIKKIGGWLLLFLTCLLPVYYGWAVSQGPEWLSEDLAGFSTILMAILFMSTGTRLLGWSPFEIWE